MTVLQRIKNDESVSYTDIAAIMGLSVPYVCKVAKGRRPITPWMVWCVTAFWPAYTSAALDEYRQQHGESLTTTLKHVLKSSNKEGIYGRLCHRRLHLCG